MDNDDFTIVMAPAVGSIWIDGIKVTTETVDDDDIWNWQGAGR